MQGNSQSQPKTPNLSTRKQTPHSKSPQPSPSLNLYNIAAQYNKCTELPDFKNYHNVMKQFIQDASRRVLFVFGPSGAGKHTVVGNFVRRFNIPCQYRAQRMDYNENQNQYQMAIEGDWKVKSLRELINECITKRATKVSIYEDFPMPTQQSSARELEALKAFKTNFFQTINNHECKLIFILNSEIYNRYYIVPKECPRVTEIIMKAYSSTEMKKIAENFVKEHYAFEWAFKTKDVFDQILEISNGDARKMLLNLYRYTMDRQVGKMQYMDKSEKSEYKFKLKNEQKFPLFHMLGKYLYAKRYDQVQKKDRVFTRNELKMDPPFYFNPVDLYNKSNVPLNTFTDLLFENYPAKTSSIRDSIEISSLFCALDTLFPSFITSKRVDSLTLESQNLYIFLLTWGIILKNKGSAEVKMKFSNFHKSEFRYIENESNTKRNLLKTYFPYSSLSGLVRWGYLVKNTRSPKKYLISDIIKRRTGVNSFLRDEEQKRITEDQEQELAREETNANAAAFIKNYRQKVEKKRLQRQLIKEIQMQDQSDIDS